MSLRAPGHERTVYFQLWLVSTVSEEKKKEKKKTKKPQKINYSACGEGKELKSERPK